MSIKSSSLGSRVIARFSRRNFFDYGALSSIVLGSGLARKALADDQSLPGLNDYPVPIPHINVPPPGGGHSYFPGPISGSAAPTDPSGAQPGGRDPSVIFNFKGFVGQGDFNLSGTGTDLNTGQSAPYTFHADMRFMDGVFVGTDLTARKAAFAFI
jgi:hypothetical protein